MANLNAIRNGQLDLLVGRRDDTNYLGAGNERSLTAFTTLPTLEGSGGVSVAEARLVLTDSHFGTSASAGSIVNSEALTFPEATSDWGTLTGVGLYRGSRLLQILPFAEPVTINTGETLIIPANNFRLSMS